MAADPELIALAKTAAQTPERVTSVQWQGHRVWVKKTVPDKKKIWHHLQRALSFLIPLPILKNTVSTGGIEGQRREIERMAVFREKGIAVPDVLASTDEWIALSHLGNIIDNETRHNAAASPSDILKTVQDCAHALAQLHRSGLAHGRARLNDMVRLPAGGIGFIDFEEDISCIPLDAAQARDVFLFANSVARLEERRRGITGEALAAYGQSFKSASVLGELEKLDALLWPLAKMLGLMKDGLKGDISRAVTAAEALSLFLREQRRRS